MLLLLNLLKISHTLPQICASVTHDISKPQPYSQSTVFINKKLSPAPSTVTMSFIRSEDWGRLTIGIFSVWWKNTKYTVFPLLYNKGLGLLIAKIAKISLFSHAVSQELAFSCGGCSFPTPALLAPLPQST